MRFRLLLCLAIAMGLGVFAFLRNPEGKVAVTYLRSEKVESFGPFTVLAIRNNTGHPVTFAGFLDENPSTYDMAEWGTVIEPQSTAEILLPVSLPHLVHAYVVPWTVAERAAAAARYSRFPVPIRNWFMRNYDPERPAYRHEVQLP